MMIAKAFRSVLAFFFDTRLGQSVLCVLLGAGLVGAWLMERDTHVRRTVTAEITTQAKEIANEARKARELAKRPGAYERLLQHSCRDC